MVCNHSFCDLAKIPQSFFPSLVKSNFLLHSSQYFLSVYLHKSMHKKCFFVKNLFSKCEHIRIKRKTSFFVSWILLVFATQSCKFFFKPNCQSLVYFTRINTWNRLVSSLLFRNQFLACSIGLELLAQELLLEHRTFFRLPLVEEVPRNL